MRKGDKMNKREINFIKLNGVIFLLIIFLYSGCTKDPVSPEATSNDGASINAYIQKLSYNPELLLDYQTTGGQSSSKEIISSDTATSTSSSGDQQVTCISTTYNLKENFENIAILRPMSGVIWPGALVKGNQSMMDGLPDPITLPRAPVTFSIDLPGIGGNGVKIVENPTNSNIQAAIDSALEWWNANAYQEGYVNSSSSSYKVRTAYSSKQIALDVGLNAEWATGDVSAQFNYQSNEQKTVIMAVYKQAFYTITMDSPVSPDAVFGKDVTLEQVKSVMDDAAPPAYVQSVTYGRIIMFRMETSYNASSYDIESAFKYAAGVSVDGSLELEYKNILKNSSIEVIVLGGNASISSSAVTARSADDLVPIIEGDNAVYSRNNPGVPISYTIRYLKDNSLAKLGYFTQYTATECSTVKTVNDINVKLGRFNVKRDCDGIEGAGEFSFEVQVLNSKGTKLATYSLNNITKSDGEYVNLSKTLSIKLKREAGNKFTVKFICTEWDKNIFGYVYPDSRMDHKAVAFTHNYNSSGSWNDISGIRKLDTNPGSDCSTELTYTISVQ
jgi:thiol-activated cytolysin